MQQQHVCGPTQVQLDQLLKPINPVRVLKAQGQSHLPAYDVDFHLTRIFGFQGWDKTIIAIDCVEDDGVEKGGRVGWTVTYRCLMQLRLKCALCGSVWKTIDEGACGSAKNLPSRGDAHDFAYKNAISYALKRCAKDLGDQFGLSLYNKGSVTGMLGKTLVGASDGTLSLAHTDVEANIVKPLSMGNDEIEHPEDPWNKVEEEQAAPPKRGAQTKAEAKPGTTTVQRPAPKAPDELAEEADARGEHGSADVPDNVWEEIPEEHRPTPPGITPSQTKRLHALKNDLGLSDDKYRAGLQKIAGVTSSKNLTKEQANTVISALSSGAKGAKV